MRMNETCRGRLRRSSLTGVLVLISFGIAILAKHNHPYLTSGIVAGKIHYLPAEWEESNYNVTLKMIQTEQYGERERYVLVVTDWDGTSSSVYEEWEVSQDTFERCRIGDSVQSNIRLSK